MASPELLQLLLGAGVGGAAVGFKWLLDRFTSRRSKEVHAQFSKSSFDVVSVQVDDTDDNIAQRVREAAVFEAAVADAVRALARERAGIKEERGKGVDFLVRVGGKTVGIEAKLFLDERAVQRLISSLGKHPKLESVYVFSKSLSPKLRKTDFQKSLAMPNLHFVETPDVALVPQQLRKALAEQSAER